MFERFTERARQVVILGQEEARTHGEGCLDSIAVLLGLLREEEGIAARVLASLDVTAERVRGGWPEYANEPLPGNVEPNPGAGQIPFTIPAKAALELALREALSLGHNYIGTEHILLGVVRGECFARTLLGNLGADSEKVRVAIIRSLSGPGARAKREPTTAQLEAIGRRVYGVYVAALAEAAKSAWGDAPMGPVVVWEFLSERERRAWIAVGRTDSHDYRLAG